MDTWQKPEIRLCGDCHGEMTRGEELDCYYWYCQKCVAEKKERRERLLSVEEVVLLYIAARKRWQGRKIRYPTQETSIERMRWRILILRIKWLHILRDGRLSVCCVAKIYEEKDHTNDISLWRCTLCGETARKLRYEP